VTEISPCADEVDERRGPEVYNAVWPHDRIGIDEERSYRASLRGYIDLLARVDGVVGGSAIGAVQPEWPGFVFALLSVLPAYRRRGAGTGLYEAISD
jgi:GNAT superfamily N-acetyltransferase